MKKYLPILFSLLVLAGAGYFVITQKKISKSIKNTPYDIGSFTKMKACARPPKFLQKLKIPQPVMIDLSQKRFKGIALHYGKNYMQTLHPKIWEQYEHFSTYAVDKVGNIYLVPTPFISIRPTTFNLQKNIYKLDSQTGKISIFMHFDDVIPSANNPYGLNAIAYDCDDHTLWVAAIDESDYSTQKGIVYHVNPRTKEILQRVEGIDVLSMHIVKSNKGKFLLVGSARDNGLYVYRMVNGKLEGLPKKLLELPLANERIRKIKVTKPNSLELQSIPFSYTLIAQSAKEERTIYQAKWHPITKEWIFK